MVRCMVAQPYLIELIDAVPLFEEAAGSNQLGSPADAFDHLHRYLC